MQHTERRRRPRYKLVMEVEYDSDTGHRVDYATDLADGGAFVTTTDRFEVGQQLSLTVSLPLINQTVVLDAVVRWVMPPNYDGPAGVGVEFCYPNEDARRALTAALAKARARLIPDMSECTSVEDCGE